MAKSKAAAVNYRSAMAAVMKQTVDDEAKYGNATYAAVRPQTVLASYTSGEKWEADCSDGCRSVAHIAKLPDDPAGNNWADFGNSSSIWTHLHTDLPITAAEIGDIFTLGFSTGEAHACMAYDVTDPSDPVVWNMGTEGQPVFRKLSQEIAGHPGMTVTLCKINLPPVPVPPAVAHLRAQTGFYSWLAWVLGESDWRTYGKKNKNVRPNVPRVIPAAWWTRYAVFLKNRKKPNKPLE